MMQQPHFKALAYSLALILIWLIAFNSTLLEMVSAWENSDTFQHCFIIAPISIWLLWRRRFMLAEVSYKPAPWLLMPTILAGLFWFASSISGIQVFMQLGAIGWLFFALWSLLGNHFFRVAWFPMCYLFFMVPIGDELIPKLQIITADITVLLLNWSSIPVFRDGLYLAIPSGLFEVAVACSGVRYLIASIALGTLYAHLQYHSLKRQIIFVIIASIVPIIANGIRAYLIVLIAHLSDMKLATGFDHLIYGWVFFGFVMFILFWLGSYWQQADAEPTAQSNKQGQWSLTSPKQFATPLLILLSLTSTLWYEKSVASYIAPMQQLNTQVLSHKFKPVGVGIWQPEFHNADAYFTGKQNINGETIEIYIAFYNQNRQGKELINYTHKLYNQELFTPQSHTIQEKSARYTITSRSGNKVDLLYWYQLENLKSAKPSQIKLTQSLSRLTSGSDSGAVIVLAMPHSHSSAEALSQAAGALQEIKPLWAKAH